MEMRIRFTELLESSGKTTYQVYKESNGRISLSTAYRLKKSGGKVRFLDVELLEALCDVFAIKDLEQLLERDKKRKR